jgi:molecular chaperone GrpE
MNARNKKNKKDNGDSKLEKNDFVSEVKAEAEESEVNGEVTELEKAEKIWLQEKEELLDSLKRKQADLDNLRRISKMEQAEAREYALYDFLSRMLPVLDNIERGLQSARSDEKIPKTFIEGQEMIRKQLVQILEQEGVSLIEAEGELFDPNCHHAVMQVESEEVEPGTIIEELQKGYRHRRRILRPSMVKVCKD